MISTDFLFTGFDAPTEVWIAWRLWKSLQLQTFQALRCSSSFYILNILSLRRDICRLRLDIISIILETKVLLESVCLLGLQLHPFLVALFLM